MKKIKLLFGYYNRNAVIETLEEGIDFVESVAGNCNKNCKRRIERLLNPKTVHTYKIDRGHLSTHGMGTSYIWVAELQGNTIEEHYKFLKDEEEKREQERIDARERGRILRIEKERQEEKERKEFLKQEELFLAENCKMKFEDIDTSKLEPSDLDAKYNFSIYGKNYKKVYWLKNNKPIKIGENIFEISINPDILAKCDNNVGRLMQAVLLCNGNLRIDTYNFGKHYEILWEQDDTVIIAFLPAGNML